MRSRRAIAVSLLLASACQSSGLPDTIWPPYDLEITLEEVEVDDGDARVVRRFRAVADGLVAYGTSSSSVVDETTRTRLPVFDRLSVYRLVPTSIRALARRLDRLNIAGLDRIQGERGSGGRRSLVVTWQAFGQRHVITARGRLHGAMAEVLAVVTAHLPPGEGFELPGLADRPVVPVLRGVPMPRVDVPGSLRAHETLLGERPEDTAWLLDAFALACHLARRDRAEELLERWTELTAVERSATFPDGEPRLVPAVLQRMLPVPGPAR